MKSDSGGSTGPGHPNWALTAGEWLSEHRWVLLYSALLLAILPMRDLWAPDEPDFAQCVREMRERGNWLLPYLNGQPYDEKPILFFWLTKVSSMFGEWVTGGRGFTHHTAAWALRLPTYLASVAFAFAFRGWASRFTKRETAETACLVLLTSPLWVWQSQAIQIDLLFSALVAWSWLSWLAGYLLLTEAAALRRAREWESWFFGAYLSLALATLAKGPLGLILSCLLLAAFLTWRKDWRLLPKLRLHLAVLLLLLVVAPWYLAAGLRGGSDYLYQLLVRQNLGRVVYAWDHIQPWWKYVQYLLGDFWPWVTLLPTLPFLTRRIPGRPSPERGFFLLAILVPLLFLSLVSSKQGKYLLMAHPFLALALADSLGRLPGQASGQVPRWAGALLAMALGVPAMVLVAILFLPLSKFRLPWVAGPYAGALAALAVVFLVGAFGAVRAAISGWPPWRVCAFTLWAAYGLAGTWGFALLDPIKNYRGWTEAVKPLIAGRKVYFWQTIRSGAMVFTDTLMPELRSWEELDSRLGPEDRLISQRREWEQGLGGLTPEFRARFVLVMTYPVGGSELLLLRKAPNDRIQPR